MSTISAMFLPFLGRFYTHRETVRKIEKRIKQNTNYVQFVVGT